MPRILGYSVLRGEVSNEFRYVRPNDHFKKILLAICNSPYFEFLRMRIGQAVKTGFTLSSDIWITGLMNSVDNKRIRTFLQAQRTDIFLTPVERGNIYNRYAKQFKNELFRSADFPENRADLEANYSALKLFLIKRIEQGGNTDSLREKNPQILDYRSLLRNHSLPRSDGDLWQFYDSRQGRYGIFERPFRP